MCNLYTCNEVTPKTAERGHKTFIVNGHGKLQLNDFLKRYDTLQKDRIIVLTF